MFFIASPVASPGSKFYSHSSNYSRQLAPPSCAIARVNVLFSMVEVAVKYLLTITSPSLHPARHYPFHFSREGILTKVLFLVPHLSKLPQNL